MLRRFCWPFQQFKYRYIGRLLLDARGGPFGACAPGHLRFSTCPPIKNVQLVATEKMVTHIFSITRPCRLSFFFFIFSLKYKHLRRKPSG